MNKAMVALLVLVAAKVRNNWKHLREEGVGLGSLGIVVALHMDMAR